MARSRIIFLMCLLGVTPLLAQGGWVEVPLPTQDTTLFRISFVDSLHGAIAGESGSFLYTEDGGMSWTVTTIPSSYPIRGCKLVSSEIAWAFSSALLMPVYEGALYRSIDRGVSWIEKPLPDSLVGTVPSFSSGNLVRIGGSGQLWVTTNGAQSWELRSSFPSTCFPASLDFYDEFSGFAGGAWLMPSLGCFLETTDGGFTWINRWQGSSQQGTINIRLLDGRLGMFWWYFWFDPPPFPYEQLSLTWNRGGSSVQFTNWYGSGSSAYRLGWATDSLDFWLLRRNGRIARTSNGGVSWQEDTLAVPVAELFCNTYGHRFALGQGRLFRFNASTHVPDEKELPLEFALFQNYPNPFNPETVIRYSLPTTSHITLRVYDVLGREVATLVDEAKRAGYYEVTFDASSLGSGVYFYRLLAGTYSAVKKLLVVK